METTVKKQYQDYPYPHRDPADEKKRLVSGTPSNFNELEHYVYGGRLPKSLRILSAGGGTGDAVVMMGQQAKDRSMEIEILHLDLSETSQGIAKSRAEARGLTSIKFVIDSLLNAPDYGPFDYIDCCGVLHHLENPSAGLKALKTALKPDGAIGLMVYAPYGRTGIYHMQSALRRMTGGMENDEKVAFTKKLLSFLPDSNWLRNNHFINDHQVSDAGVYDLLLHSTDRAYTVEEFAAFVRDAGLDIITFIEKMKYDPESFLPPGHFGERFPEDRIARAALAEEISGILYKHVAYVAAPERAKTAEIQFAPETVPFYNNFNGQEIGRKMKPGEPVSGSLPSLKVSMTMPRLAGPIMREIDGKRSWRDIHAALSVQLGSDAPDWDRFWEQATEVWKKLHGLNLLLLRQPE